MGSSTDQTTGPEAARTQDWPRKLLRYVDRSSLDQFVDAFIKVIGIQAGVVANDGQVLSGVAATCSLCGEAAVAGNDGWAASTLEGVTLLRCEHGLSAAALSIVARSDERLGAIIVGPVLLPDMEPIGSVASLDREEITPKSFHEGIATVPKRSLEQLQAAASFLARTVDTVAREAVVAGENVELAAKQRQANRELSVLYTVTQALSSGLDLEAILQRLVDGVGEALGIEVVTVALIEGDALVMKASRGFLSSESRDTRLKLGEGFAGRVAASGLPMTVTDMQSDPREYLTAVNTRENIHAFAGVPLILHGETIGVLGLYRRVPYEFPESELQLLSHISDHATVAIERARLYEQERHTVAQLRALNTEAEAQRQILERTAAIHDRLTQMVLEDSGLAALVKTVANLLQATVAVEDRFFHLLAYASDGDEALHSPSWISLREHLNVPEVRRAIDGAQQKRRPVFMSAIPAIGILQPRVIAPVLVSGHLLGYLWAEECRPLHEQDYRAMEHATTIVALEMMKQRTEADVENRLRGDLLDDLISIDVMEEDGLRRRATYLGYDLEAPHALFVFEPDEPDPGLPHHEWPEAQVKGSRTSQIELLNLTASRLGPGHMVTACGGAAVVVAPLPEATLDAARRVAETLKHEVTPHSGPRTTAYSVGVGRVCHQLTDYPLAFSEARKTVALIRSLGGSNRVIAFDDLGIYRLLAGLPQTTDAVSYSEQVLSQIDHYDRHHSLDLLGTLECYLSHGGAVQKTAVALGIHVNTLAYRLQRLKDLSGVDIGDSDTRLELHLALKIRHVHRLLLD
jgi:sugar diacid utilization regulator/ligand-binding sensor protein